MCVKSHWAVNTFALAMRYSEKTGWENDAREALVNCPDSYVKYKLSRIK